jgi:hypothetical protein
MYKINFYKLVVWLIPEWLRLSNVMIILKAIIWPIVRQYNRFVQFRTETIYRLQHNCQVCFFQKVLNDRFDALERRIRITNFDGLSRIFFWSDAEKLDLYFGTNFFWPDDSYRDSGVDFNVMVPADCATSISDYQHLIALIDEYRLAGKSYEIKRT